MGVNRHPNDVQIILGFAKDAPGNVVRVDLDAEAAEGGASLFRLSFTPAQFTRLLSSGVVVTRSSVDLPTTAALADCQESDASRGDCDGTVREYTVQRSVVCGHVTGEPVLLCAGHAAYHGQKIRRAVRPGICGQPVDVQSRVRCGLPANHTAPHHSAGMDEVAL